MDYYEEQFAPGSTKPQYVAALLLGDRGSEGYKYLPALFDACRNVDLSSPTLTKRKCCLVGYGAQSMGRILKSVGYDDADAFHRELFHWMRTLTESSRTDIIYMSTVALGHLGTPPEECPDRLCELLKCERRPDERGEFTCRAVAFRALAQADRDTAAKFINTDACHEFIDGMRRQADAFRTKYPENPRLVLELANEASWLFEL